MNAVNPSLWWLLWLALVPILIHLLVRQRLPRTRWATMTFLMLALKKRRKRLLLETILLLIVRTAIIIALILVVVRPIAAAGWQWLGGMRGETLSVLVIDDSASMAASDGIQTRFERAISRADHYLDELAGGSQVLVLLAARQPEWLIEQPVRDVAYVRDRLSQISPRDGASALPEALETVRERLAAVEGSNREVLLFTDAQAPPEDESSESLRQSLTALNEVAPVFVLTVPETPAQNLAIEGIRLNGGPNALIPSFASTLWPTRVTVTVCPFNYNDPVDTAVELLVDGRKVARQQVTVQPDRPLQVSFEHGFRNRGEAVIEAQCEGDLFERDNRYSRVVDVVEQVPVLVIDGRPAPDPFDSASGYLRTALWPRSLDDPDTRTPLEIQTVSPAELESVRPADFALIVMADVAAVAPNLLQQLKAAVRNGTGLWVIAGEQVTGENLSSLFFDGGDGPLPLEFGARVRLDPDNETVEPVRFEFVSPLPEAVESFNDPSLASALAQIGWQTVLPVENVAGDNARTWGTFSTGGSSLVANQYGSGRVVYFGAPVSRRGTDFPVSPAFVPFVQELAFYLIQGGVSEPDEAGASLAWSAESGDATLVYPDESSESAARWRRPGTDRVVLPSAHRAGVYALRTETEAGIPRTARRAVRVPSAEYNILTPSGDAVAERFQPATVITPEDTLRAVILSARVQSDLSTAALVLLILLLLAELGLVYWFTPKPVDADALLQQAQRL